MSNLEEAGKGANSIRSILLVIITIFGITGSIATGYGFLDSRFAHAEDVEKLEKRVTLAELKTSLRTALEEYYFLKQQQRKYPEDVELAERVTEAKKIVDDLREQIKKKTQP